MKKAKSKKNTLKTKKVLLASATAAGAAILSQSGLSAQVEKISFAPVAHATTAANVNAPRAGNPGHASPQRSAAPRMKPGAVAPAMPTARGANPGARRPGASAEPEDDHWPQAVDDPNPTPPYPGGSSRGMRPRPGGSSRGMRR
jgi:hypothetical protein